MSTRRSRKLSSAVRARVRAAENKSRCAKRIKKIGGGGGAQATLRPDVRAPFSPDPCAHRICFGHTGSSRPGGGTRKKTPPSFLRAAPLREQPARCSTARHATRTEREKKSKSKSGSESESESRARFVGFLPDDATATTRSASGTPRERNDAAPEQNFMLLLLLLSSTRRADGDVEKG